MKQIVCLSILAVMLFACDENSDSEPVCIAPPECGTIDESQVTFTIYNNTQQVIDRFDVAYGEQAEYIVSEEIDPVVADRLGCYYNFDGTNSSRIAVRLSGDGSSNDPEIVIPAVFSFENGGIYWIQVNADMSLSISAYDPSQCNDTIDVED